MGRIELFLLIEPGRNRCARIQRYVGFAEQLLSDEVA
jgi:hypothetical protein